MKDSHDIHLYEKNDYYGGHARTVTATPQLPVDTGFIVFNHHSYPQLSRFFRYFSVPIKASDMSFGVSINHGKIEYSSRGLRGVFAQRRNLFNPAFWWMLACITKFNRRARRDLRQQQLSPNLALGDYLKQLKVSHWFIHYYLLPMAACIWSTPLDKIIDFPALTLLRFFDNHGLLRITKPIPWYTVDGGSRVYVEKITASLSAAKVIFHGAATQVKRIKNGIELIDQQQQTQYYDKVIFACHSNQALQLLVDASKQERQMLGNIRYQTNQMVLHQDSSFMPKRTAAWSSWSYLSETHHNKAISLSYWMNNLQSLASKQAYFVTINPHKRPQAVVDEYTFEHPVFDSNAIHAQTELQQYQGKNSTYFCGAYLRYGFHEDGLLSAINIAKLFDIEVPW